MKILDPDDLELLHRQGLCEDIRNKLSAPLSLADIVLNFFDNTELNEEKKKECIRIAIDAAKISRDSIEHITASLDYILSLSNEKIPELIRGNRKK